MNLKKVFKISAGVVIGLLALVAVAAGAVYGLSQQRLKKSFAVVPRAVAVPADAASVERGRHIANTRGCIDCHDTNFAGRVVVDDPAIGRIAGPNLTRGQGGLPADYSDADYVRAIRHGLARDGRAFVLMPSVEYSFMSDEDLGSLIAYLKSVPAVDRARIPVQVGPVARALILAGEIKLAAEHIDHAAARPERVTVAPTADYGRYLAVGCTGCHGDNLAGGKIPGGPPQWPAAANLTPHAGNRIATWSEAEFIATLRTGKRPDGSAVDPVMPLGFGQMTDVELKALWLHLRSLAPVASAEASR